MQVTIWKYANANGNNLMQKCNMQIREMHWPNANDSMTKCNMQYMYTVMLKNDQVEIAYCHAKE